MTYKESLQSFLHGLQGLLEVRDKTEAEAIALSSAKPNTVFYTTDTRRIVIGGVVYGGGAESVLSSRIYTGVLGSANNDNQNIFIFGEVFPNDMDSFYAVTFDVDGWVENDTYRKTYRKRYRVRYEWDGATLRSYNIDCVASNYIVIGNSRQSPVTASGFAAGKGCLIGFDRRNDNNPVSANHAATVAVRLVKAENCSVTLFDELSVWGSYASDVSGGLRGTLASMSTRFNGNMHTGDQNSDINAYNIRYNGCNWRTLLNGGRNMIMLKYDDRTLLPVTSVDNGYNRTDKPIVQYTFDPFGEIFYYGLSSAPLADSEVPASYLWLQYSVDLRYSFNVGQTLEAHRDVYLRCVPESSRARLHPERPICQSLPDSDDGLIYIYLGRAYGTYQVMLSARHPIYESVSGKLRLFTGRDERRLGKSLRVEDDGLWQVKNDGRVYPVAHPDLSTQPSVLPERLGTKRIYEVLAQVYATDFDGYPMLYAKLWGVPKDCVIISATAFNSMLQAPVATMKLNGENGEWSVKLMDYASQAGSLNFGNNLHPEYVLVKYYLPDDGGYGYY